MLLMLITFIKLMWKKRGKICSFWGREIQRPCEDRQVVPGEGVPPFCHPAEMARRPQVFFLVGLLTRARLSLPFPLLLFGVFCAGAPDSSEETLAPPGSPLRARTAVLEDGDPLSVPANPRR